MADASLGLALDGLMLGGLVLGGAMAAGGGSGSGGGTASSGSVTDTTPPATPTLNPVAQNNVVNAAERAAGVTVSGTAESGSTVTVEWGSTTHTVTAANGVWSVVFTPGEVPSPGVSSVTVTARDAAGNVSDEAVEFITIDTQLPTLVSVTANTGASTLTLTYSEALDPDHPPLASSFLVGANGTPIAVSGVTVAGSTVILTLADPIGPGLVTVNYTDPTAGDDGAAVQDDAGNDAGSLAQGVVADGYISGATVYIDTNGNGQIDVGTDRLVGTTDLYGRIYLDSGLPAGGLLATGGVNIDTGIANTLLLRAPAGASVLNPLTTLVQTLMDRATPGAPIGVVQATAQVLSALGLPPDLSPTTYDPLAHDDVALQQVAAQIGLIVMAAQATVSEPDGYAATGAQVMDQLAGWVAAMAQASTAGSLTDPAALAAAWQGLPIDAELFNQIGATLAALAATTTLPDIARIQSDWLDFTAPAPVGIAAAALTRDDTPTVRITLATNPAPGAGAVAGDRITVRDGDDVLLVYVLTTADLARGHLDLTLPALDDGLHALSVTVTDLKQMVSVPTLFSVTVDTQAPILSPLSLAVDTGASATDGISRQGVITVIGLDATAGWQYSVNGGLTWVTQAAGTSSFTLAAGTYGATQVVVRQTDAAGNASATVTLAAPVTIDATPPATPSLTLVSDTGTDGTDGLTAHALMQVGGLEPSATWAYSLDAGQTWVDMAAGTTQFTLPDGTHAAGAIQVRQTDAAGHTSGTAAFAPALVVDTEAPVSVVAALVLDTGVSDDGITSNGTVQVSGREPGAVCEYAIDGGPWTAFAGTEFTLPEGVYPAGTVQVRQTDAAGNTSVSALQPAITVDSTPPAAPGLALVVDTGLSPTDGLTGYDGVRVTGLTPGGTWTYSLDGGQSWLPGESPDPGEDFTILVLPEGTWAADTVWVRQTDVAGNVSAAAVLPAVTIDGTSPETPALSLRQDTGASDSDGITADGTVVVSGLEPGAQWQYSTDGGTHWVDGSGTQFVLADGQYAADAIRVRQTDPAGNPSPVATLGTVGAVTVDTVAPPAAVLSLLTDTDTAGDGISTDGTVQVSGLEPGTPWAFTTDNGQTWNPGSDDYFVLSPGIYAAGAVQVRQTDAAGHTTTSALQAQLTIQSPPLALTLELPFDTGASASDGITYNGYVLVGGLSEGGAWEYSLDGTTWLSGNTATSAFVLPPGSHAAGSVTVRQIDPYDNQYAYAQLAQAITVDVNPPSAPTLQLQADTGAADGITSNPTVLVGALEAGTTWQYSVNGGLSWLAGTGQSFDLADGTYTAGTVRVRQTDAAGNISTVVASQAAVTIDRTVATPGAALAADTGSSSSDGITQNGQVQVSGLEAGGTWQYSLNGGSTWLTGSGSSFVLATGSYADQSVQIRQTDRAGNASVVTALGPITVDVTPPSAPTLQLQADTGTVGDDFITANGFIEVGGLQAGTAWQYSIDGGTQWLTGSGNGFLLGPGTYAAGSLMARQTDAAGNQSAATTLAAQVEVDTEAPILTASIMSFTGTPGGPLAISGLVSLQGGGPLIIDVAGDVFTPGDGRLSYPGDGSFALTVGAGLAPGYHLISLSAQDMAGNLTLVSVADLVLGGSTPDVLVAQGTHQLLALAGDAGDFMFGGLGNDTLLGGAGADFMTGGGGHDILDGGTQDPSSIDTASYKLGGVPRGDALTLGLNPAGDGLAIWQYPTALANVHLQTDGWWQITDLANPMGVKHFGVDLVTRVEQFVFGVTASSTPTITLAETDLAHAWAVLVSGQGQALSEALLTDESADGASARAGLSSGNGTPPAPVYLIDPGAPDPGLMLASAMPLHTV